MVMIGGNMGDGMGLSSGNVCPREFWVFQKNWMEELLWTLHPLPWTLTACLPGSTSWHSKVRLTGFSPSSPLRCLPSGSMATCGAFSFQGQETHPPSFPPEPQSF